MCLVEFRLFLSERRARLIELGISLAEPIATGSKLCLAFLGICIDEIFGNIARYAYGSGAGSATLRLDFDETERLFSLTFIDGGEPFDPRNVPEPDITSPLDERPIGGLGLFMVKKMVDSMTYRRENELNILTICKRI